MLLSLLSLNLIGGSRRNKGQTSWQNAIILLPTPKASDVLRLCVYGSTLVTTLSLSLSVCETEGLPLHHPAT